MYHILRKHIGIIPVTACMMLLSACLGGCSGSPELSDVVIFVTPEKWEKVELKSGEKEQYELEISTIHDYVTKLVITSFEPTYGQQVLLEEEINQKKTTTTFVYTAPEINSEEGQVKITFEVWDNEGNTASVERTVNIINEVVLLPEKSGIVLHSPFAEMPDALSFANVADPFTLQYSPEPERADLYVECNENFTSIIWKSNTKAKFIRYNTFNYTDATALSINNLYKNSLRSDYISDIKPKDIIIVGHGDEAEGVFQVTSINKGDAFAEDYMIVSYKGIKLNYEPPVVEEPSEDEEL